MGAIKDALRKILTEEAERTGRDIRFIDTPTQVIETAKQAKQHDMELVEKPRKRKYGAIVYEHNPYADHEKSLLFLYVLDQLKNKSVGYIAFTDYDITVCRGCPFGQYNMWSKTNSAKTSFGLNSQSLKEATEYFERIFADERYQFIITKKGKARANEILKIQVKKGGNKKQLISAVGVIYVHNLQSGTVEPNVLGEVFYMRKTRILKRRVRKVIYSLAVPLDGHSIDSTKQEMRELLDDTVRRYYERC